jgi:hypothetical protein
VALTAEVIEEILAIYKRTRSPFKIAQKAGVTVDDVFEVINSHEEKLTPIPERHGGFGRPELQDFTVARRLVSEREWDNSDEKILEARANYEIGTHIMTTGRDGAWLILYSIPRKGPADPLPDYFLPEVA